MSKARRYHIGETRMANCGMKMTIIEYHSTDNVVVKFEDGYIKKTSYKNFLKGMVKNLNYHIGETRTANNGMKMTIIEYHSTDNVVVKFEDGYVTQTRYDCFSNGTVKNSNYHIGETHISNYGGIKMTIIEYHSYTNIVVQFEDGYVKRTRYDYFLNGTVKNPNYRIGETCMSSYGIPMTIIEYHNNSNLVVRFQDGSTKQTTYYDFINGAVRHPFINKNKLIPFNYHRLICRYIYSNKTDAYYVCKCNKCGYDEILSAKELVETEPHKCISYPINNP